MSSISPQHVTVTNTSHISSADKQSLSAQSPVARKDLQHFTTTVRRDTHVMETYSEASMRYPKYATEFNFLTNGLDFYNPPVHIDTHTGAKVVLSHPLCSNTIRVQIYLKYAVISYLKRDQHLSGITPHRHLYVYGPGGVGTVTTVLKKAAESGAYNVIVVNTDIYNMHGVIDHVYTRARTLSPCVVVFDEADGMFSPNSEKNPGSKFNEFIVNQRALERDFFGCMVWTISCSKTPPLSLNENYRAILKTTGVVALCGVELDTEQRRVYFVNFLRRVCINDRYPYEETSGWEGLLEKFDNASYGCTFAEMQVFLVSMMRHHMHSFADSIDYPTCDQMLSYMNTFCSRVQLTDMSVTDSFAPRNKIHAQSFAYLNAYTDYLRTLRLPFFDVDSDLYNSPIVHDAAAPEPMNTSESECPGPMSTSAPENLALMTAAVALRDSNLGIIRAPKPVPGRLPNTLFRTKSSSGLAVQSSCKRKVASSPNSPRQRRASPTSTSRSSLIHERACKHRDSPSARLASSVGDMHIAPEEYDPQTNVGIATRTPTTPSPDTMDEIKLMSPHSLEQLSRAVSDVRTSSTEEKKARAVMSSSSTTVIVPRRPTSRRARKRA